MRRQIGAIFVLGVRSALRSRLVMALFVLLIFITSGIKGDGTAAGELRMQLTWTLGTAFAVLSAASLWIGCSTLAADIETGRHTGTAVSPVPPAFVWIGRWLAIVTVNVLLLAFVMVLLFIKLRTGAFTAGETAVSRLLEIDPQSIEQMALNDYNSAAEQGLIPPGISGEEVLELILKDLRTSYISVDPEVWVAWHFMLEKGDSLQPVRLKFSFVSPLGASGGVEGYCEVRNEEEEVVAQLALGEDDIGSVELYIPAGELGDDASAFTVVFQNTADPETGTGVLVHHMESVKAYVPSGGMALNMLKCWFALSAMFALLAAIGVTCGSMFSFPVAAFVSTAIVCVLLLGQGSSFEEGMEAKTVHGAHENKTPTLLTEALNKTSGKIYSTVNALMEPYTEVKALDRLGDSIAIDMRLVGKCVFWTAIVQPFIFGAFGSYVLRRREFVFK
ncbi:MAG: hypothetical protein GX804_08565 [Lentisphaerae bacterium]|nr:hypothetical protein [Lentisphaerota bacterium]